MNERIRQLNEQIRQEEKRISNCEHTFDKVYYNPETVYEGYGIKSVVQGSDIWSEYEGYRNVKKDRWTRKCNKCGYEQHTNKQEPIIKGYQPKF
jgi:hypothetical protein